MAAKRSNSSFSYTLLVTVTSFCLIQMSVGRPVEISDVKFNVPYFTSFGRQSCQSCGKNLVLKKVLPCIFSFVL